MKPPSSPFVAELWVRESWRSDRPYPATMLSSEEMAQAWRAIRAAPEYRPTPLRSLHAVARNLALAEVAVKDESCRFGLGGVKALGAPYGLQCLLEASGLPPRQVTAVAATDGNHGLALAWAATRVGCQAQIFVGSAVDEGRLARIRAAGGIVVRVDGTYDDAVAAAEQAAQAPACLLVTDTDYQGNLPVTRAILAGYTLLAEEICAQTDAQRFTHVFLQCGVGGVAAGLTAGLWHHLGRVPRLVAVEPVRAASLLASLRAGHPVQVGGSLETRMIGLACGQPSLPAWRLLESACFAAMSLVDEDALAVQLRLGPGYEGDLPLSLGDTGVAGIAGLWVAASKPDWRARLGLDSRSRVLVLSSEGASP